MSDTKKRRLVGAIIVLVGAILLIAALFTPWYSFEVSTTTPGGSGSTTINSYPGLPSQNGTVQYSCSGSGSCPSQTSYSKLNENNTGVVAETGFFLLIVGFVLGLIGAILGIASRGNARRASPALALAAIGMILAILTPALFAVSLPGALSKDVPSSQKAASGPWSSFIGSNSTSPFPGVTVKLTWGPAIGWYLSFVAFVILLVGVIFLFLYRKDPPEPVGAPAPAASTASTAAPPH